MWNRVKLASAQKATKKFEVEVRPDLYADKCACCGEVFQMKPYCNDQGLASLSGTFDRCDNISGNIFVATCCSFACAHKLFAEKGWKKLKDYKHFAKDGAELIRAEIKITAFKMNEAAIRDEWSNKETNRIISQP